MGKKILAGILAVTMVGVSTAMLTGCGSNDRNSQGSSSVEEEKAYDKLEGLEVKAFDAILDLSTYFKKDTSIRVKEWYTLKNPRDTNELNGLFLISGENAMGGSASHYYSYNVDKHELEEVDEDDVTGQLAIFAFTNEESGVKQSYEVIDRLNKAIVEYFDERGY